MTTKTISIMSDVYKLLRARKREGDSFSDVIRKTLNKSRSLMDFAGAWGDLTDREISEMKAAISKLKDRSSKELLAST